MTTEQALALLQADLAATQAIAAELQQLLDADEALHWAGSTPYYTTRDQRFQDTLADRLTHQNEVLLAGYYQIRDAQ